MYLKSALYLALLFASVAGVYLFQQPQLMVNLSGTGTPAANGWTCDVGYTNQIYDELDTSSSSGPLWVCDTATGSYGWRHMTVPGVPIKAVTGNIGGSLISLGCVNQTPVSVPGATTAMACTMSGAGGTQPNNVQPQCFVSSANNVTPQFCTALTLGITPSSQPYNISVY